MKQTTPPKSTSPSIMSPQQRHGRSKNAGGFQQYFLTICVTAAVTWSIAGVVMQMKNCTNGSIGTLLQGHDVVANHNHFMRELEVRSSKEVAPEKTMTAYNGPSRVWKKAKNGFPWQCREAINAHNSSQRGYALSKTHQGWEHDNGWNCLEASSQSLTMDGGKYSMFSSIHARQGKEPGLLQSR
jgi:hypothetical protein